MDILSELGWWGIAHPFLFGCMVGAVFAWPFAMIFERLLGRKERREHREWLMRGPVHVTLTEDQITAILDQRVDGEEEGMP